MDAWSIYRFIEEFCWLSQLSHPHLVKLYDAFCEGDIRYFSMELIEGKMVREWFRVSSRWGYCHAGGELRRVLEQFASAVEYLHDHQVLHCDLKCSNMMITSGNPAPRSWTLVWRYALVKKIAWLVLCNTWHPS